MATLSTPIIPKIDTFDPSQERLIEFIYTGNQIIKNRAIVIDNETYQTVYDNEQYRMRLDHSFPAGTFSPGRAYQIRIKVYDNFGNESEFSSPVLFHCYSTPVFIFSNLTNDQIIRAANVDLNLSYQQDQNDPIKEFQFQLYDYDKSLITTSSNLYDENKMNYSFTHLKNEHTYYARAIGLTTHDMQIDTGFVSFIIQYVMIPTNVLFLVKNHTADGTISLESGVIDIGYETTNDNYTIKNGELIIGADNTVTYNNGFTIEDEFQVFLKARYLPLNYPFFKMRCPSTDESLWLQIESIDGVYYAVLYVPYGGGIGYYNIFAEIPNSYLTNSNGELLTDTENNMLMMSDSLYSNEFICVYDIEYKKGWYDLRVYHEDSGMIEDI